MASPITSQPQAVSRSSGLARKCLISLAKYDKVIRRTALCDGLRVTQIKLSTLSMVV